jgi:hypothetical protein
VTDEPVDGLNRMLAALVALRASAVSRMKLTSELVPASRPANDSCR